MAYVAEQVGLTLIRQYGELIAGMRSLGDEPEYIGVTGIELGAMWGTVYAYMGADCAGVLGEHDVSVEYPPLSKPYANKMLRLRGVPVVVEGDVHKGDAETFHRSYIYTLEAKRAFGPQGLLADVHKQLDAEFGEGRYEVLCLSEGAPEMATRQFDVTVNGYRYV